MHDRLLIAALAAHDDDLSPSDEATARGLLAACTDCARLHDDLRALTSALPAATTPARPRDFTLTEADAERLRPRGLRRWIGLIGSARDGFTRPLAIGFTTLGLAGLLVATVPGALPGGSATSGAAGASAAAELAPASIGSLRVSEAPSAAPVDGGGVFSGGDGGDRGPAATDSGTNPDTAAATAEDIAISEDPTGLSTMAVLAGLLLIVGLGLFALRWTARRLG